MLRIAIQRTASTRTFFILILARIEGLSWIGESPLFEIADAIKKIKEDLRHFIIGFKKPIILVESLSKYRQEFEAALTKKEQEAKKEDTSEKTANDSIQDKNMKKEEGYAVLDEMVGLCESDQTDGSVNHDKV